MPYYCVSIRYYSKITKDLEKADFYDMNEEIVRKRVAEPYMSGEEFFIGGRCIDPHNIESIRIYKTEERASFMAKKEGISISYIIDQIKDHQRGEFVTDFFITSPPATKMKIKKGFGKKVFIVHGKDHEPVKQLEATLKEFGLEPIILHEQPSGSKTIVEKLEKYSDVGYAFVILTPDDVGVSFEEIRKLLSNATGKENFTIEDLRALYETDENRTAITIIQFFNLVKQRARQNVVMEFGYFMGLLGRERVCCLYKGDIELPSDMHGIVYIPFKESIHEARDMIAKELQAVGYKIKL